MTRLGPWGQEAAAEMERKRGGREEGVTNQGGLPGFGAMAAGRLEVSCPNWEDGGAGLGKATKRVPMRDPRF